MTPTAILDASVADLRVVADKLAALACQMRPPPVPEPVPEPPLTAFGVRYGYGPAAATVPEAIADVQIIAARRRRSRKPRRSSYMWTTTPTSLATRGCGAGLSPGRGPGAVVHAHMGVSRSAVEGIVFPGVTLDGCPV